MPTQNRFWLTDEDADLPGYLRLKLGSRSDAPSLVRSVTNTAAGPSSGIQITRTAAGTALAWISDPLKIAGDNLDADDWEFHVWASESSLLANAALRFQILRWTNLEASTPLDDNNGTELTATTADYARTSGNATSTTFNPGDRLVLKVLVDDAGTLVTGHTVTVSYNGEHARAEGDSYIQANQTDEIRLLADYPHDTVMRVRRYVKDTDAVTVLVTDEEVDQALDAALRTYSRDRPREVADYLSGDGSAYQFRLPRRWVHGFSRILEIEYPTGNQNRTLLEPEDWMIETGVLGPQPRRRLWFPNLVPESGTDNILLSYTTRHVHSTQLDTLPGDDYEAVCWLAAALACEMLATKMAASSDSTIAADSVNYRDGEQRFASRAKAYRKLYSDHVKGESEMVQPASIIRDFDTNLIGGGDRLFHRRRLR